jgi:hypothetical protein
MSVAMKRRSLERDMSLRRSNWGFHWRLDALTLPDE